MSDKVLKVLCDSVPDEVRQSAYQSMGIAQVSSWRLLYHFAEEDPYQFVDMVVRVLGEKMKETAAAVDRQEEG